MKKNLAGLLFVMLAVLICQGISLAGETVWAEGDSLVVGEMKEIKRYDNAFSGNVSAGEIDPETARQLIEGKILRYEPKKGEKITKIFFWHFPIKIICKSAELSVENGVIVKRDKMNEPENSIFLDFFYRLVPFFLICAYSMMHRWAEEKNPKLLIFYGAIFLSVVLNALIGSFTDTLAGGLAGLFTGGLAGLFTGLFAGGLTEEFTKVLGWQNAAINDYLITLAAVCLFSLISANILAWAKKKYQAKKIQTC